MLPMMVTTVPYSSNGTGGNNIRLSKHTTMMSKHLPLLNLKPCSSCLTCSNKWAAFLREHYMGEQCGQSQRQLQSQMLWELQMGKSLQCWDLGVDWPWSSSQTSRTGSEPESDLQLRVQSIKHSDLNPIGRFRFRDWWNPNLRFQTLNALMNLSNFWCIIVAPLCWFFSYSIPPLCIFSPPFSSHPPLGTPNPTQCDMRHNTISLIWHITIWNNMI